MQSEIITLIKQSKLHHEQKLIDYIQKNGFDDKIRQEILESLDQSEKVCQNNISAIDDLIKSVNNCQDKLRLLAQLSQSEIAKIINDIKRRSNS